MVGGVSGGVAGPPATIWRADLTSYDFFLFNLYFPGHLLGCSPRNGNTCRIKESARIWTDLLESWFRLKYLSFSLNILRVWTVLKFFKCPQNRKVHFLYHFACVSVFWGSLFGNNPMKHFGGIIWGPTSVDVRPFVSESYSIGQFSTAPGGYFEIVVLQWQNYCLECSKTDR